eukprot:840354-Amphidinium_carterae.1
MSRRWKQYGLGRQPTTVLNTLWLQRSNGKVLYTRSLTRMTPEQQWNKEIFESINIPQMDATVNEDYTPRRRALASTALNNSSRRRC